MAIKIHSKFLYDMMQDGKLHVVTREKNGCGTGLLVDWANAWMHLNYNSKAVFLFDSDKAGKDARNEINENKKNQKRKYKLQTMALEPTEEIKAVSKKIHNVVNFTIEHLLSCECWRNLKDKAWVEERGQEDLFSMFSNVIDRTKSLDNLIDELIDNEDVRNNILLYKPKDEKKSQILNYVKNEIEEGNNSVLEGLKNTIDFIEKEFKPKGES